MIICNLTKTTIDPLIHVCKYVQSLLTLNIFESDTVYLVILWDITEKTNKLGNMILSRLILQEISCLLSIVHTMCPISDMLSHVM